ncbi:hypothetical protein [Hydrogenophaga sp. T2]|uniref:hypothetical protein n=1 Tax=Hydrogenophaga sp. T2 TaxID=3132823 RepID=UPI003CF25955
MIAHSPSKTAYNPAAEAPAHEVAKTNLIALARGMVVRAHLRGGSYTNKVLLERGDGTTKLGKAPSRFNLFARRKHENRAERYAQSLTSIVERLFVGGDKGVKQAADQLMDVILAQRDKSGRTQLRDSKALNDALTDLHAALTGSAPFINGLQGSVQPGSCAFAERMADVEPRPVSAGTPTDHSTLTLSGSAAKAFASRMQDLG